MAGYLGSVPVPQATQHRESFTCTEGQTSFATAGYTAQFVDVYLNGSHLSPADFTATNGSDVVLGVAASADDVCDIISYTPFEVADQTFTGTTTMDVAAITGVLTTTAATVFNGGFASNAVSTITTADNSSQLKLISTDTDVNRGPVLELSRVNSGAEDSNRIGSVIFTADDDAGNQTEYASITGFIQDASNTTEDAGIIFDTATGGNPAIEKLRLGTLEAVFNEDGVNNLDFRVESLNLTHALFVNASTDRVGLGTNAPGAPLDIRQNAADNASTLVLRQLGAGDSSIDLQTTTSPFGFAIGVDGSDADSFKIAVGPGDVGSTTALKIDTAGIVTKPLQPAFSATINATQSNLAVNAAVRVKFAVVTFDNNSDFTVSTGDGQGGDGSNLTAVFTAPVTGKYQLNLMLRLEDLDAASAYYIVSIHTSNRLYRFIFDPDFGQDAGYWSSSLALLVDMDTSDTAFVSVVQHSGTAQTDVTNSTEYTTFSGYLVA